MFFWSVDRIDINMFIFIGIEYYLVMNIFRDKYKVYFGFDNCDFICMEKGWLKLDVMLFIIILILKFSLIINDIVFFLIGLRVLWLVFFMFGNIYYFL